MKNEISTIVGSFSKGLSLPEFRITDALEILILAVAIYYIMKWIKNTKAWMLLRGMISISLFVALAWILQLDTILFLAKKLLSVIAIGAVVIFQPEIRRALERLGEHSFLSRIFTAGSSSWGDNQGISTHSMKELVTACEKMAAVKTGALIVVEQRIVLSEYERTGIQIDSLISEQLVMNIFEHNTPLHDGAVIIRENRIVAATCYLPLSDNLKLDKDLGTRHRAAVGLSEVSDALVITVSEETGQISYAREGKIMTGITSKQLMQVLKNTGKVQQERRSIRLWRGKEQNGQEDNQ